MARTLESVPSATVEKPRVPTMQKEPASRGLERSMRRYDFLVREIEQQIKDANDSKKEATNVVAGMGDWIGEKTGAYSTGKEIYASIVARSVAQARELHAKLLAELQTNPPSESERAKIDELVARLEKASGAKLEGVGWADAVLNTSGGKDLAPVKYGVRATFGALEGGYEGVAGIAEISGKFLGILAAYSFEPKAREVIEEDVAKVFSALTLENAKKLLAALPKALEAFQKLPADRQIEGAAKLIGNILVPLGIGAKGVQAGKAIAETGIAITKAGTETAARAARIVARQTQRASGVSERALKVAGKAATAGVAAMSIGTAEVAMGTTAVAGGIVVRGVGEMGGGKAKKTTEAATAAERSAVSAAEAAEKNSEALRKAIKANPALDQKIEKEAAARKAKKEAAAQELERFVDNLTNKADASKIGMSKEDLSTMGDRSKGLIREISASEKIRPEITIFLSDMEQVLTDKLSGANLKSLTHILESIVDVPKIPPNPKIAGMLREYGDISQADFFAIVTIFHDLDKSFMPAQFLPDLHAILKGKNLTSHQLDSANFLKELSTDHPGIHSAIKRIAQNAGAKGPEWIQRAMAEISQKLAEAYERVIRFFESKGLIDPQKRANLVDLMFDVIKGHAVNTEFMQVDAARGAKNAMKKVSDGVDKAVSEWKSVQGVVADLKALLSPPNGDGSLAREFEAVAANAVDSATLKELSQKFVLKTFLKANIGTDLPLEKIDVREFGALVDALNANVRNADLRDLLKRGDAVAIEKIVADKAETMARLRGGLDKYLHARSTDALTEEVRFAFNLNDIIGYAKPNSEGFIKLVGLEGGPQGGFDLILASPFNSLTATLAEIKTRAANSPEYAKMYATGLENAKSLTHAHSEKMASPFVWKKDMPATLRQFDGKTFGETYGALSQKWPKFGDDLKDATKFDQAFVSELSAIKGYFVSEFKAMCGKVPTKEIYS